MVPISPKNNNNNSNNSIGGHTCSTSQPSVTAIAATITCTTTTCRQQRIGTDHNQNRALSCFGKFLLVFFSVVTFSLCVGTLGTVVGPDFPTITAISTSTSASHLDFSISLANPNKNGLSYTNLRLTADYLVKVNAVEVRMLFPSVASPEFDQAGGESRVVTFRVVRGNDDMSFLPEVEIEFRAKVRYKGYSWLVKGESDMRAKCKRVKAIELRKGMKMQSPNCVVDGFWQTARIMMLGSTLVLPFLVLVFLCFSSYRSTSTSPDQD